MFKLYFDELPEDTGAEEEVSETPEVTPEAKPEGKLTDDQFDALSDEEQKAYWEKGLTKPVAPEKKEEVVEEPEVEEEDEPEEDEVKEVSEEVVEDDEPSVEPVTEKRFKDTQHAFRTERSKRLELEKRFADLEKKVSEPNKLVEQPVEEELTLANIKPEVLADAYKKDPINTQRWVADQQVKQSMRLHAEEQERISKIEQEKVFVKQSEEAAIKKFPVLQEILDMSPEAMEKLKESNKMKYEFGKKTAKYFEEFKGRGDKEAFYNAAARAYVELSPQMIKDMQLETKRLAEKEMANKKRVLGKVSVSGNQGTVSQKGTSKHKSLTNEEFLKLDPEAQRAYWMNDINSKNANRSRK